MPDEELAYLLAPRQATRQATLARIKKLTIKNEDTPYGLIEFIFMHYTQKIIRNDCIEMFANVKFANRLTSWEIHFKRYIDFCGFLSLEVSKHGQVFYYKLPEHLRKA